MMRYLAGPIMVVWLALLGSSAVVAQSDRPATITFTHKERSLKPGEVILLKARSTRPLKALKVEAFDHEFPAFDDSGGLKWSALIGIDLSTKPGRYRLKMTGVDRDGKSVVAGRILSISTKRFPTRRLAVDEKFVTPPADVTARIEEEGKRVKEIFASVTPDKFWSGPFRVPVPGEVISAFGKRNIYNNKPRSPHSGTDFRGKIGTPIRAPNAGRIVLAEDLYYSGKTVIVDHGFGLYSYLGHMSEFSVKEGDRIKAGEILGKVGATGRVTGPHLHWTVRLMTTLIDPMSLVSVLGNPRRTGAAAKAARN